MTSVCRRATAAVVVPLLLWGTGCASGQTDDAGTRASDPETGMSGAASTGGNEPVAVRVEVSGGFTGEHFVYEVRRGDPPPRMTAAEVDRVLALAGRDAVRDFAAARPGRVVACCDQRLLDVTIRYADGRRTRIRTTETSPVPAQVRHLVALLLRSS